MTKAKKKQGETSKAASSHVVPEHATPNNADHVFPNTNSNNLVSNNSMFTQRSEAANNNRTTQCSAASNTFQRRAARADPVVEIQLGANGPEINPVPTHDYHNGVLYQRTADAPSTSNNTSMLNESPEQQGVIMPLMRGNGELMMDLQVSHMPAYTTSVFDPIGAHIPVKIK